MDISKDKKDIDYKVSWLDRAAAMSPSDLRLEVMLWSTKRKAMLIALKLYEAQELGEPHLSPDQVEAVDYTVIRSERKSFEDMLWAFKAYERIRYMIWTFMWQVERAGEALLRTADLIKEAQDTEKRLNTIWNSVKGTPQEREVIWQLMGFKVGGAATILTGGKGFKVNRRLLLARAKEQEEDLVFAYLNGQSIIAGAKRYGKRRGGMAMFSRTLRMGLTAFYSDFAVLHHCFDYSKAELAKREKGRGSVITDDEREIAVFPDPKETPINNDLISEVASTLRDEERRLRKTEVVP